MNERSKREEALWRDEELRNRLRALDDADVQVSMWEASFIEGICFKEGKHGLLSEAQRAKVKEVLERYGF